jgi:RHS repeat-associated protein
LTLGDKTLTYHDNGNLTSIVDGTGTTIYTWNARNQLTGISGPGVTASFVYDGIGRREKKTINSNLTEFLFDEVNPVQETSGTTVLANILSGLAVDEFFARTDVPAATTSQFLPDALGSPIALADSAGAVQTEYAYEPFGGTTVTGTSNSNSFQYTGRENDGTGLFYYRARYFHPGLQRFISEDPIEFEGGDINLYGYVGNDPINRNDPSGKGFGDWLRNRLTGWLKGLPGKAAAGTIIGGLLNPDSAHAPQNPGDLPPPPRPPKSDDNSAGPDDQCSGGFCWPTQ